ncbi:MAG: hypothetical protein ACR2RF_04570 [Geminicoccaceae bacterium]
MTLACHWIKRQFPWLTCLFADASYQGPSSAISAGLLLEVVKRPPHAEGFKEIPRRWVIERTFGWVGRNRRLAKDFERLIDHFQNRGRHRHHPTSRQAIGNKLKSLGSFKNGLSKSDSSPPWDS